MSYDGRRLKWVSGLDSLKKIIHESLGLQGKWSSPGGGSKKFTSTNANLSITWYYGKQNTKYCSCKVKTETHYERDLYISAKQEARQA